MDHYIDIRLRPDPEFSPPLLLNALHAKLHRALVAQQREDIGVSFPSAKAKPATLGDHLRLHGSQAALAQLMASNWLSGMHDHVAISDATPTPAQTQHREVRRIQCKSSPERLRRRLIKRQDISEAQAREQIPDSAARTLALPFLTLRSLSTGQQFRLFIEHRKTPAAVEGKFNAYGLSNGGTVPWF